MTSRTTLILLTVGIFSLAGRTTSTEQGDAPAGTTTSSSSPPSSSSSSATSSASSTPETSQVEEPAAPAAPDPVPVATPTPESPPAPAPAPVQQPDTVIGMTGAPGHDSPRPLNKTIESCGGDLHQRGTTFFTDGTSGLDPAVFGCLDPASASSPGPGCRGPCWRV